MSRVRRVKPSTVAGRKRQAELGQIISSPRTSKNDRAAALEELNLLAPVIGSPIENEDSFPTASNPKPVRTGAQDLGTLLDNGSLAENVDASPAVPALPKFAQRSASELDNTRARLWPLLSTRTVTPETIAFAIETVTFSRGLFGKKFSDLSQVQQAAFIEFQLDAWSRTKSSPKTGDIVAEVLGIADLK
jgi:hypothetical protein